MGWLDFDEQVIDEQAVTWVEQGQVLTEAKHGEEIQGFFGFDGMGVAKDAIGATEVIAQFVGARLQEFLSGVVFALDDLFDDLFQTRDDFPFSFAEGILVTDLKEVGEGFGAFAVDAANGEADAIGGVDDLIDLFTEHQSGKVHHGGGAQAGTEVGRAGGEVAEFVVVGERQGGLELGIDGVEHAVGAGEVEPWEDGLHAQVVLLIDHDAEVLGAVDDGGATWAFGGLFSADEVAFDEHLFLQGVEFGEVGGESVGHVGQCFHAGLEFGEAGEAFLFFGPPWEWSAGQVASEADPGADHDVGMRSLRQHPGGRLADEGGETHHGQSSGSGWWSARPAGWGSRDDRAGRE